MSNQLTSVPAISPAIPSCFYYDLTNIATRVTELTLKETTIPSTAVWLNFVTTDPELPHFLSKICALSDIVVKNLCQPQFKPRSWVKKEELFFSACGFAPVTVAGQFDMIGLNLFRTEKLLITISQKPVLIFEELLDELQIKNQLNPQSISNSVIAHMFYQIEDTINDMQEELFNIEARLNSISAKKASEQIWNMRKSIINYLHHFHMQEDMLGKILSEKVTVLGQTDLANVEGIITNVAHCTSALHATENLAMALQDKIDGIASDAMNKKVYLLSILALFVVPLNLLGSLIGMNVPIPGQTYKYAFEFIVGGGFLIAGSLYVLFKIRKWL